MVFRIIIQPLAHADLEDHMALISKDSPTHAEKWLRDAWVIIFSLAEMPKRFAVIEEATDLGIEVRDVPHFSHRIVYRIKEDEQVVEILRVWHTSRSPLSLRTLNLE